MHDVWNLKNAKIDSTIHKYNKYAIFIQRCLLSRHLSKLYTRQHYQKHLAVLRELHVAYYSGYTSSEWPDNSDSVPLNMQYCVTHVPPEEFIYLKVINLSNF